MPFEWLIPWHAAHDPRYARELAREAPAGHVLKKVPVRVLACRQDCDDVLFALDDGSDRVAVVHLTYAVESDSHWPLTTIFRDLGDFAERCMRPDHDDFVG